MNDPHRCTKCKGFVIKPITREDGVCNYCLARPVEEPPPPRARVKPVVSKPVKPEPIEPEDQHSYIATVMGCSAKCGPKRKAMGFAALSLEHRRAIASKGGKAAHKQGRSYEWTTNSAREAGRKGGNASRGGRGKLHDPGVVVAPVAQPTILPPPASAAPVEPPLAKPCAWCSEPAVTDVVDPYDGATEPACGNCAVLDQRAS